MHVWPSLPKIGTLQSYSFNWWSSLAYALRVAIINYWPRRCFWQNTEIIMRQKWSIIRWQKLQCNVFVLGDGLHSMGIEILAFWQTFGIKLHIYGVKKIAIFGNFWANLLIKMQENTVFWWADYRSQSQNNQTPGSQASIFKIDLIWTIQLSM